MSIRAWWKRLWDLGIPVVPTPEQMREARELVARQTAEAAERRETTKEAPPEL